MSQNYKKRNTYSKPQTLQNIEIKFREDTYVDEAEKVILELKKVGFEVRTRGRSDTLTTSQIRNLLNLTSTLYDEVQRQDITQLQDRLAYLRVQFVYQSGRNQAVKKLIELADILNILKKVQEKKDKELLIRFCRYIEALVAYFKYYGGQD